MLFTPVLLIVFNRPEITQKAFDQIRKVKPRNLFIAADGPRADKPEDYQKCAATREIIQQVDWECDLKTLVREQNRGCGYGPAEAISWFFSHVEKGIVLEDDCLADETFFYFCEELLETYKADEQISMIGGTNPLINWKIAGSSYIFSNMGFSWGWASWRRAWKDFDYTASRWATAEGKRKVKDYLKNETQFAHFSDEFDYYFKEVRGDVWDFQWLFCRFHQGSYSIVPTVNLITNIGFDQDSTHTFDANVNFAQLPIACLELPLRHPKQKKVDTFFDWYVFERFFNRRKRTVAKRVALKAVKSLIKFKLA